VNQAGRSVIRVSVPFRHSSRYASAKNMDGTSQEKERPIVQLNGWAMIAGFCALQVSPGP
jgi:hypothetical protein